jgi:hypothetical protein
MIPKAFVPDAGGTVKRSPTGSFTTIIRNLKFFGKLKPVNPEICKFTAWMKMLNLPA